MVQPARMIRLPQECQSYSPTHDLKQYEARPVGIVGAALIKQVIGGFDAVQDNDMSSQNIEVENIGVEFFSPFDIGILGVEGRNKAEVAENRFAGWGRRKRQLVCCGGGAPSGRGVTTQKQ